MVYKMYDNGGDVILLVFAFAVQKTGTLREEACHPRGAATTEALSSCPCSQANNEHGEQKGHKLWH